MAVRSLSVRMAAAALLTTAALACTYAPRVDEPLVFSDTYVDNNFNSFAGANGGAVSVDTSVKRSGSASLRIAVPSTGYAGGAFVANSARDLSGYNALTFWAKADYPTASFAALGLGNDNTGNSRYPAQLSNVPVGTDWQKFVVPMPLPAKMSFEQGLMFFSAVSTTGVGFNIWIDEARYELLDASVLGAPVPHFQSATVAHGTGEPSFSVNTRGTDAQGNAAPSDVIDFPVTQLVGGAPQTSTLQMGVPPAYLRFATSNPDVAVVDSQGLVTPVGGGFDASGKPLSHGAAVITATLAGAGAHGALGDIDSPDKVTVNVTVIPTPTTTPAAPPTRTEGDVISLLSAAYANVAVDTWGATWSNGNTGPNLTELSIGHDAVKKYSALAYVGIEFINGQLDATAMTHIHLDVWSPDASSLAVQLIDFAPDGVYSTSTNKSGKVNAPSLARQTWVPVDLPLSSFVAAGLTSRAHLAQLILVIPTGTATVYVDNVYFYQ